MAAPKGNQFSYNGGKPPLYDSPEELWDKITEYFESTKMPSGKYQPTIEGLTFYLGFATRKSLLDYADKSEVYLNVVGRAKGFIKSCYEKQLYGFAWAGSAFALKNIGRGDWQDEVTQNQNTTVTQVEIIEKQKDE